jgi:hypothetical protein
MQLEDQKQLTKDHKIRRIRSFITQQMIENFDSKLEFMTGPRQDFCQRDIWEHLEFSVVAQNRMANCFANSGFGWGGLSFFLFGNCWSGRNGWGL